MSGNALQVYSHLTVSEALKNISLNQAVLKQLQLTEGFYSQCRTSKPDAGESPSQFLARPKNIVEKWLNLANSPRTYEGFKGTVHNQL